MKLKELHNLCNNSQLKTVYIVLDHMSDNILEQGYYHYLTEKVKNKDVFNFTVVGTDYITVRI